MVLFCVQVPVQLPDVGPLVLVLDVLHLGGGGPLRPGVPHPDPGATLRRRLQLGQAHTQGPHEALLQVRDLETGK